nr:NUDIX domain-containing protein [uncultured Brumimicrobium sp.]
MYKVFVNNVPIYFQKDALFESNIPTQFLPNLSLEHFDEFKVEVEKLNSEVFLFIKGKDPFKEIQQFFNKFEWIEAAGGIVQQTESQKLLFIFRNGFWDIPKGKIEAGENPEEGAIREIQEECGLKNLKIVRELSPTFHVYFGYGKHFIKKTHWFALSTQETKVSPQLEEDITEVRWFDSNEIDFVKEQTFASILDVLEDFERKH